MSREADCGNLSRFRNLLLAIPSRDILAIPLWVSVEGDLEDIVELEMSSRHLLARNARLNHLQVLVNGTRRLVIAMGVVDGDKTADALHSAKEFECPARMFHPGDAGIALWKEFSQVCVAFYNSGECVHFTCTGESTLTAALCEALSRTAERLRWEEVLPAMPARALFLGEFSDEEAQVLGEVFRIDWSREDSVPPPVVPEVRSAPLSPNTALRMQQRTVRRKALRIGALGAAIYAVFLLIIGVDLLVGILKERGLERAVLGIESTALEARSRLAAGRDARPAVDPTLFAIDQQAAVAGHIPGDRVRLTEYEFNKGKLFIAGEAADVSESYEFFERVRNDAHLQEYDWIARQPKLSGRNKVRFEMEGTRYDAETGQ
jgi:hypothetical protein